MIVGVAGIAQSAISSPSIDPEDPDPALEPLGGWIRKQWSKSGLQTENKNLLSNGS
jgi:hypothetical protein